MTSGNSNCFSDPSDSPFALQLPAVRAVQGDCERVYSGQPWETVYTTHSTDTMQSFSLRCLSPHSFIKQRKCQHTIIETVLLGRNDKIKQSNETLSQFFSSVFTKELDGMWELSNKPEIKTELNLDISKDAILKKLNKIKISKSPGPDSIHPRVLRELSQELVTPLSLIFETSVRTGTLPNAWKQANITALHKKGSRHVAGNYRPVSLTSVVCKLLESLIRDALVTYMSQNGLFSNKQFGFITGRSTTLQLLKVLDRWTEILDAGGYVDVIYCDFKKAFDTVPHKRLVNVLKYYSIQDPVLSWIEAFLKRSQTKSIDKWCTINMAWCYQWHTSGIGTRTSAFCSVYQYPSRYSHRFWSIYVRWWH